MSSPKKYAKPEGFKGRGNSKSYKTLKWKVIVFDKEKNEIKEGKFATKEQAIEGLNLNLSPDTIYRLATGAKVDTTQSKKGSSFLSKYGHIKVEKINELAVA